MRRAALPILLLGACVAPLGDLPDGGLEARCWEPSASTVFRQPLVSPTAGCSLQGQPTGVLDLRTSGLAPAGGVLVVPPADAGTPLPLVLVFHGAGGTGDAIRDLFPLDAAADGGAIVIYPTARRGSWDIGERTPDGDLVSNLIRWAASNYCVDPARIYAAGFSAGAVFTLFLGCNVPETFRAVGVVAGTDVRFNRTCCRGTVSAMLIHGTADEAIPYGEGQTAVTELLFRDQCTDSTAPDGTHCNAYSCPAAEAVDFCTWDGDHTVPPWASDEVWRFFTAAP
jgi:poly(3-hydroxybutyrate) depolymerase